MDRWTRLINNFSTNILLSVFGIISALLVGVLFYLIWNFGTISIGGIPLQLVAVTIIFPVFLTGLLSWLARTLERLSRRAEDE